MILNVYCFLTNNKSCFSTLYLPMTIMEQLKQEMESYSETVYHKIQQITSRDCYLIIYTDFIYRDMLLSCTKSEYTRDTKQPVLNLMVISLSKHKYAKQIKNKIIQTIDDTQYSFKIKFHSLWTGGLKDKEKIYVQKRNSGIVLIRHIEGNTSMINKINASI